MSIMLSNLSNSRLHEVPFCKYIMKRVLLLSAYFVSFPFAISKCTDFFFHIPSKLFMVLVLIIPVLQNS